MRIKRTTTIVPPNSPIIKLPTLEEGFDTDVSAMEQLTDHVGGGLNVIQAVKQAAFTKWSQGESFFVNTPLAGGGYVQEDYAPIKD